VYAHNCSSTRSAPVTLMQLAATMAEGLSRSHQKPQDQPPAAAAQQQQQHLLKVEQPGEADSPRNKGFKNLQGLCHCLEFGAHHFCGWSTRLHHKGTWLHYEIHRTLVGMGLCHWLGWNVARRVFWWTVSLISI
jgi:hypothetical protein